MENFSRLMSMRARALLVIGAQVAGLNFGAPANAALPPEGSAAPAFEVRAIDGRNLSNDSARGKVIVLHFWATWCHPCREELPLLDAFYRAHRDQGVEIISVSIEDARDLARVQAFTKGYAFPVAMVGDAKVADYGPVPFLPLTFVIDRKGVMRKSSWTGNQKINAASLDRYVKPLISER